MIQSSFLSKTKVIKIPKCQENKNDFKRKKKKEVFKIPHMFQQAEFEENKINNPNKKKKIQKAKTQTYKVPKKSTMHKEGTTKRIKR